MEHYEDIIRSREIIKRKFNALRRGETEAGAALEKHFRPVVEPLKAILKIKDVEQPINVKKEVKKEPENPDTESPESEEKEQPKEEEEETSEDGSARLETYIEKFGPLTRPYFHQLLEARATDKRRKQFDHVFGVRHGGGEIAEWMIGNKPVSFDENDKLYIGGTSFGVVTPGLLELVFKCSPHSYTVDDLHKYKRILQQTNAHRVNFTADGAIRVSRSKKYTQIVRNLFPPKSSTKPVKSPKAKRTPRKGAGLFVPLETKRSFIYWDDPNELVERLALLAASREAGNTGLEREILSIEEELREGGYIV